MDRVRYLEHQGKQILLTDLSNQSGADIVTTIVAAAKVIRTHPPGSLLTVTDTTNVQFTLRAGSGEYDRGSVEAIRSTLSGNRAHVRASAIVVPPDDARRILVEFFNRASDRQFEIFETMAEALGWLARQ